MTKKRILIVEDEPFIALDESTILRGLGYEVVGIASSGIEAIKLAEESKPDLVLMDIKLTGAMDGREAALKILEFHQAPMLYVTAYGDKAFSQSLKAIPSESMGHIVRPFTEEELASEIKRLIG